MKFALMYETQRPSEGGRVDEKALIEETLQQWVLADELGYDYLWLVEHHFLDTFSISSSPDILLGAASRMTKRIRLGFGVLVLPQHHPVRVAEKVAMVDQLSGGRVDFGTGRGGIYEQTGFEVDPRKTRAMWDEAMQMIPGMWQDGEFSWSGDHWNVPARQIIPKPLQKPHPPMWLAGMQPSTYRMAADHGLGMLSLSTGAPSEMAPYIAEYRERIKRAKPLGVTINNHWAHLAVAHCSEDKSKAQTRAVNAMKTFFGPGRPYTQDQSSVYKQLIEGWGGVPDHLENQFKWVLGEDADVGGGEFSVEKSAFKEFDTETLCDRGVVIAGDPAACVEGVRRHQEAGEDQILLLMQLDTIPHEQVLSSIRLFAEEVIPEFR